ncbi:MAG: DUF488 family protein [Blastocatellia bacterium]
MTLFSIGHSNVAIEGFVELLRSNGIEVLVDTRSQPYSRYLPHFAQRELRRAVEDAGIQYVYLGDKIGGRPEGSQFYLESGKVDYDLLSLSEDYLAGSDKLVQLGAKQPVVFMCAEADYHRCHRYLLITRTLVDRGIEVRHILHSGEVVTSNASEFLPEQPSLF